MAITKKGKFLSGIIGNIILYELNGKQCARIKPSKLGEESTKQHFSKAKQDAISTFSIVMKLMQHFSRFAIPGFGPTALNRTAFQEAMSVNLNNYKDAARKEIDKPIYKEIREGIINRMYEEQLAATNVVPDQKSIIKIEKLANAEVAALASEQVNNSLDWIQLSIGNLSGATGLSGLILENNKLVIKWQGTHANFPSYANDSVMVLITAENVEKAQVILNASTRNTGNATIILEPELCGKVLSCFVSFRHITNSKPKRGSISNSQYFIV